MSSNFIRVLMRRCAQRIRAGERIVLKRWLRRRGLVPWDMDAREWYDVKYLMSEVQKQGGDAVALQLQGRDMVVAAICKERGL